LPPPQAASAMQPAMAANAILTFIVLSLACEWPAVSVSKTVRFPRL